MRIALRKQDGNFTESEKERALLFLETHFPEGKKVTSKILHAK